MSYSLLRLLPLPKDDPVAFTFFTGYMAMLAAFRFFLFSREAEWLANGKHLY